LSFLSNSKRVSRVEPAFALAFALVERTLRAGGCFFLGMRDKVHLVATADATGGIPD
jgi:hypothetical protein